MTSSNLVIFCAGRGKRLQPYTDSLPKPLLPIPNEMPPPTSTCPLACTLDIALIHPNIHTIILVVGYKKEKIIEFLNEFYFMYYSVGTIQIVEQKAALGTGHALQCAKPLITSSKVFVLNGDDIYSEKLLCRFFNLKNAYAILGYETENVSGFGTLDIVRTTGSGSSSAGTYLRRIEEKTQSGPGHINIGAYMFTNDDLFQNYEFSESIRGEYEIVDLLNYLIRQNKRIYVMPVLNMDNSENWYPMNTIEQYKKILISKSKEKDELWCS